MAAQLAVRLSLDTTAIEQARRTRDRVLAQLSDQSLGQNLELKAK